MKMGNYRSKFIKAEVSNIAKYHVIEHKDLHVCIKTDGDACAFAIVVEKGLCSNIMALEAIRAHMKLAL